jgi:hypothetical protein
MVASPSWYEPAAIDAEHLEWLERTNEPALDAELPIVDVSSSGPSQMFLNAC